MTLSSILEILLTIIGALLTAMAGVFLGEFKELRKSVDALNLSMALVLEKVNHHETRLERLERLEGKKHG